MGRKFDFDYTIIGSGPAGLAAAFSLAKKTKKKIAVIEGRFFGGTNYNTRDIPYRVAINLAYLYHEISTLSEFSGSELSINFPTIINHQLKTTHNLVVSYEKKLKDSGVTYLEGYANFLDENTIAIGEKKLTSRYFILATGSELLVNDITGTEIVNYLTPETAIRIRRLPKAVIVVGAGATGCEIAEYFAKLGTKVLIIESKNHLLPREDKEIGKTLEEYFKNELNMTVLLNSTVVALEQDELSKRVIFRHRGVEKMVRVDCIVLATGSRPILDYGLENAGVKYDENGIATDRFLTTSTKNIFAIGDSLGGDSSTERADYEGKLLAYNLTEKNKKPVNYDGLFRTVKTDPEVIIIGKTEDELIKNHEKYLKAVVPVSELDASEIDFLGYGFLKLLADPSSRIIGATLVSRNAELLSGELSLIIKNHLNVNNILKASHAVNNYNYLIELAAKKLQ